jgi:hypothetical protein
MPGISLEFSDWPNAQACEETTKKVPKKKMITAKRNARAKLLIS